MSKASKSTRWDLGTRDMARIARETAQYKGESLWQDAWRRLKRTRSAFWSLVFLVIFGLLALLAPLLPLPSPTAFEQTGMPQPPIWIDGGEPGLREEARAKLPAGARPTRSHLGGAIDNGWRHRAVLDFVVPEAEVDLARDRAAELVAEIAGRSAVVEVLPGEEEGTALLAVALPLRHSDPVRVDYESTGRRGEITVMHGLSPSGDREAVYVCDLALDPAQVARGSVQILGRKHRLFLELTPNDENPEGSTLAYDFRHEADLEWSVRGVSIGASPIEISSEGPTSPEEWVAGFDLPEAALQGDVRIELHGEEPALLFERVTHTARESRARVSAGLRSRVEAALPAAGLPDGTVLGDLRTEEGYTWDVSAIDAWMLEQRGSLFGLWQARNWAGTDAVGRDLLARILWGSRTSILVALAAALCSLLIGVTYGAFSGLVGGRVDNLMMRIVDMLYSVPFIFVVIFLITLVGEYRGLLEDRYGIDREVVFFVVIGAIYWLTMARVVRGQVLSLKNSEFIEAARVVGASTPRILFSHIVPNVLSIVIVYLTLTIPAVMLFEAFLSFLGLGIEPPKVSWGLLAADSTEAISPIRTYWWLVVFPAVAMGSTLLALNVLGDGLRDALDPKLRGKD